MDVSTIDILWIVIASALVFLMQPGFMCLESGLTRSKNSINVAVKNIADFILSVLSFWILGYGLMFGLSYSGIIGMDNYFFECADDGGLAAFFFSRPCFAGPLRLYFQAQLLKGCDFHLTSLSL